MVDNESTETSSLSKFKPFLADLLKRYKEASQFKEAQENKLQEIAEQIKMLSAGQILAQKQLDIKNGQLAELEHTIQEVQKLLTSNDIAETPSTDKKTGDASK